MEKVCAIGKCKITSLKNPHICFFPFPTDFNLCMLWVQKCGVPKFVEDFAYGGAQPFMSKHICSQHFRSNDLLEPGNPSAGIKLGIIPSASSKLIKIKDESVRNENFKTVKIKLSDIKQQDFNESGPGVFSRQTQHNEEFKADLCSKQLFFIENVKTVNAKNNSEDDFSQNVHNTAYTEEFTYTNLSSDSFNSYSSDSASLHDLSIIPSLSDEAVKQRLRKDAERKALKRKMETPEETRFRLQKEAQRAAVRRSNETENQRQERLRKNAFRAAMRRQNETSEQREMRRQKDIIRSRERRLKESEIEARIRRYNDAVRAAFRRKEESEKQRNERRIKDVIRAAKRRKEESSEQRAARLKKDRERVAKRRQLIKMRDKLLSMGVVFDELGQIVAESNISLHSAMFDLLPLTSVTPDDESIQNEPSFYEVNINENVHDADNSISENPLDGLNTDYNMVPGSFCESLAQDKNKFEKSCINDKQSTL